ncbi:MAG: zinc-binding dehydrogenase [Gaiellaceae bacterium]
MSIAEEPSTTVHEQVRATYFVVEPNRGQLVEIAALLEAGTRRPAIDSVFRLVDARAAFSRVAAVGKRGKVVLQVADD